MDTRLFRAVNQLLKNLHVHVQLRPLKTIRASAHEMLLRGVCKGEVQLQLFLFLRKDSATLSSEGRTNCWQQERRVESDSSKRYAPRAWSASVPPVSPDAYCCTHCCFRRMCKEQGGAGDNRTEVPAVGDNTIHRREKLAARLVAKGDRRKALWQFARHDIGIRLVFGDVSACLQSTTTRKRHTVTVMIEHFVSLIFNVNKKAAWVRCVKMALSLAAYHPSTSACVCARASLCASPPLPTARLICRFHLVGANIKTRQTGGQEPYPTLVFTVTSYQLFVTIFCSRGGRRR